MTRVRHQIAFVVIVSTLSLTPSPARCQAVSETDLVGARADIAKMEEPELRSLLNYLAECADRISRNELVRQACRAARIKHQTEFGSARSIDTIINDQEKLVDIVVSFKATGQTPSTAYIDGVDAKLREAIAETLKSKRKP